MAFPPSSPSDPSPETLSWLKTLPVAPEYHPTPSEFQDPISYILKIEKEASRFGICKIVPPLPPPPKKSTISNLTRSLSSRNPSPSPNPKTPPTFTTRQQQIGFCPRKPRPVQKPVWQSGETYTVEQFEVKAKQFEKNYLRRSGRKAYSPLEIETLFWKACADKPFSIEYANDMPGSAFDELGAVAGEVASNVGDSNWNMRGVSRAKGSLLEFMREEIPGVTSPMVYIAMLFSWFAWHVEDHDLHSLNYLHLGAGKTWYGVPKDAALAFEEVVRVHGYGGEVNPLVTFAILGEKTTVMSPEVLISAGIPCCRLVQNAGEFVVTFPRAYHSGFSHGFNCGEAANIATPAWLRVAKEAAIRRASINYPPMVSHFQLLYALALSLCSRIPTSIGTEPRSSRLKDKKRGEGEMIVKESFVQSVVQNNDLLHILLEKGSSCLLLPRDSSDVSLCSNSAIGTQIKIKPRLSLGLCSPEEALEASGSLLSNGIMGDRSTQLKHLNGFCSIKGNPVSGCQGKKFPNVKYSQYGNLGSYTSNSDRQNMDGEKENAFHGHGFLDQGQLSCVTCGILSFACMAIVQPTEAAARHLMSSDCSFFDDWNIGSDISGDTYNFVDRNANSFDLDHFSGRMEKYYQDGLDDVLASRSSDHRDRDAAQGVELVSDTVAQKDISSLDLLAVAYGDSSDSENEDENDLKVGSFTCSQVWQSRSGHGIPCEDTELPTFGSGHEDVSAGILSPSPSRLVSRNEFLAQISSCASASDNVCGLSSANFKDTITQLDGVVNSVSVEPNDVEVTHRNPEVSPWNKVTSVEVPQYGELVCKDLDGSCNISSGSSEVHQSDVKVEDSELHSGAPFELSDPASNGSPTEHLVSTTQLRDKDTNMPFMQRPDKDSCRMHVFCLEHAIEVEKQLRPIGGVQMFLLCHPDYPKVESQAKSLAKEFGINHLWKDIVFRDATEEDREKIRSAMADEESVPNNRDWAVKLRINLYYSVELSKAPLYSKQMPYNSVIYKSFGRSSSGNSPTKPNDHAKRLGRQKKIVLAGKWCGKVWMSNQVHPYLAHRDSQELEPQGNVFHTQGTDENHKVEPRPTTVARKYERKRRNLTEKKALPTKKLKSSPQWEESPSKGAEDLPENSTPQSQRILRSGLMKRSSPLLHGFGNLNQCNSNSNLKDETEGGPSTRLRRRPPKPKEVKVKPAEKKPIRNKKANKPKKAPANNSVVIKDDEQEYQCDMDGCTMGFSTKQDLLLHKRNICPIKGCGKKFFSHKYIVQHRRVHLDDRPLKCPWKGCKMSFKWAWARTEHIRVHTGARPYICREAGCGQTFRFVSDFSRHKRKTGHSARKGRG